MTDTAIAEPLARARTNTRKNTVVDAYTNQDDALLLFDPANELIVVVEQDDAQAFLEEANRLQALVTRLVEAKAKWLEHGEALSQELNQRRHTMERIDPLKLQMEAARKEYDAAYEEVKKELGDDGYLTTGGDGQELLELIPLAKRRDGGKPREWGRKWTYVRSKKVKNHLRTYRMGAKDSAVGQAASFIKEGKIDTKALRKQFGSLDANIKNEWFSAHDSGFFFPSLQAWASAINVDADADKPAQFSAGVGLFRYFAGCGAGGAWNPKEGKLSGKLNASAEIMLAHGEAKIEGFAPSSEGWVLALDGVKSGEEFHIGAIRLAGWAKVSAGVGASVAAELSVEVDYSSLAKPGMKGARQPKGKGASASKAKLADLGAGVDAGADLFAGAKVGGEVSGAFQYRSPEKGNEFGDIAKIGPKFDLMLGAGAAGALMVTAINGKFRIKAKAGVCLGPGAKGEVCLEVDANQIGSFLQWLYHALLNAGFEFLEVLTQDAYTAAMQLQVLMVNGVADAYDALADNWDKFQATLEREDARTALMNRVLANPDILRHCTPEAHGILLWELSRHGKLTKTTHLWSNSENWEMLGRRKRAIMQVCQWSQCKSQFENAVQHMASDGAKGSFNANMQHLLNFMEIGPGDSDFDETLFALYMRLPVTPPRGYPVADNTTSSYRAQIMIGESPTYLAQLRSSNTGTTGLA